MTNAKTRSSNPYQQGERPELVNSAVVWLDIMGFKQIIIEARATGQEQQVLEVLADALKRSVPGMKPAVPSLPARWIVKGFTDNFVIGYPLSEDSTGVVELDLVLYRAGRFQLELAREGFFLRGAAAIGTLYIDDNLVYGSALMDAYLAEQNVAKNLRVVLTETARAVVDTEAGPNAPNKIESPCWLDADGQKFVNYLRGTLEFERDDLLDLETVELHREALKAKLGKHVSEPGTWAKYEWAARYHNTFLDLRPDLSEDLRIPID